MRTASRLLVALLPLLISCDLFKRPSGTTWTEGSFPAGFLWGTATAGFQVEAGCPTIPAAECEDRYSDWYQFVTSAEARADPNAHVSGQDISAAPGFYELYAADLDRAQNELGSSVFRMGVEWSRIFPQSARGLRDHAAMRAVASAPGLAFYRAVLQAARDRGLKVMVTLNHYSLPLWIHDGMACRADLAGCTARGWLDDTTVDELAAFSGFVAAEYGDLVDLWATQNEPLAIVLAGYLMPSETRTNPPAVSLKFAAAKTVAANLQIAHARQYDAVKQYDTADADGDGVTAEVGLVYNIAPVHPARPENAGDQAAAEDTDYLYNRAFLDGVVKGDFDPELDGTADHRADMAGRMDFLGVNYYTRVVVEGTSDGMPSFPEFSDRTTFNPLALQQGADYPRGIYEALMFAKGYGIPLMVTENGATDPDDKGHGEDFLVQHLTWVSRAIRDGADVRGYLWWSLMDNFEWNHGMSYRFGMFAVDDSAAKNRTPRRTAAAFKRIATGNAVPQDLLDAHPAP
ncbi:MAG: glycoside hydrolase family 1 protein [Deltaproteobacteria bacterium]|nr:glycoside hydrolase family 1 protein [Deltaproteobacteria bacterium]